MCCITIRVFDGTINISICYYSSCFSVAFCDGPLSVCMCAHHRSTETDREDTCIILVLWSFYWPGICVWWCFLFWVAHLNVSPVYSQLCKAYVEVVLCKLNDPMLLSCFTIYMFMANICRTDLKMQVSNTNRNHCICVEQQYAFLFAWDPCCGLDDQRTVSFGHSVLHSSM